MNIDPKSQIAGVPILKVRRFLRSVRDYDEWTATVVQNCLALSPPRTRALVRALERKGYVELTDRLSDGPSWRVTLNGNSLAIAKATKPLKRVTAERKLHEFLDRVRQVAESEDFLYKVEQVVLFGSYLTSKEKIGDIDVAVKLAAKVVDEQELNRLEKAKVREARRREREFRSFLDALYWPQREVLLHLKSRSTAISLHMIHDPILKQAPQQVIYEDTP